MKRLSLITTCAVVALTMTGVNAHNPYLDMDMKDLKTRYVTTKREIEKDPTEAAIAEHTKIKFTFKYRKGIEGGKEVKALLANGTEEQIDTFLNSRMANLQAWYQKGNKKRDHVKKETTEARKLEKLAKRKKEEASVQAALQGDLAKRKEYLAYRDGKTEARAKRFLKKLVDIKADK
jgi:hypothetical protein